MVSAYLRGAGAFAAHPRAITTHEGGIAFAVDCWARLRRFLILGSEGGSFYVGERALTAENTAVVTECLGEDPARTVEEIVAISGSGRAARNDPAIFALAMAAAHADPAARAAALAAVPRVCRTGTHLFHFAAYVGALRGWGRGLRRAIGAWYGAQPLEALTYQAIKYRQRDGWTHADLLRLSHPKADDGARNALYKWIVDGEILPALTETAPTVAATLAAFAELQALGPEQATRAVDLIRAHRLPRETVPTALLNEAGVWDALLADMPMTAMLRNLGVMSRVGLVTDGSDAARTVRERLADRNRLRTARIHPLAALAAVKVYGQGHGARSNATWTPVTAVIDALDGAFYAAFGNVEPAGKRIRLALDVSGSMHAAPIAGLPSLSAMEAAACMALVTAATEPAHEIVAYGHELVPVTISPRQRLDDVMAALRTIPFGGTFCALPVMDALRRGASYDAFVSYTDSETWDASGRTAAYGFYAAPGQQAPERPMADYLREYRERTGQPVRSVVVATSATAVSIADPADGLSLDVVGFDASAPRFISAFVSGAL